MHSSIVFAATGDSFITRCLSSDALDAWSEKYAADLGVNPHVWQSVIPV